MLKQKYTPSYPTMFYDFEFVFVKPMYGRSPSKRGVGCQFGPDVTRRFLENNNLDYIIRSHEVKVINKTYKNYGIRKKFIIVNC